VAQPRAKHVYAAVREALFSILRLDIAAIPDIPGLLAVICGEFIVRMAAIFVHLRISRELIARAPGVYILRIEDRTFPAKTPLP
jgi:hypothetical protein